MSIELSRIEEFALITLNRPNALNALSFALIDELSRVLDEVAASDARVRVCYDRRPGDVMRSAALRGEGMATSRTAGSVGIDPSDAPARTPGTLGLGDHGDPNSTTELGDTPGTLGLRDQADPSLPPATAENAGLGNAVRTSDGTAVAAGQAPLEAAVQNDPEIEGLDLSATARKAAYELKKAHPAVKFTSGRRNKEDQARAMSQNVVKNRKWIEQTYKKSTVRDKCQEWVDNNADKKTAQEIEAGLLSVFNSVTDDELSKISKHLSGDAFDVQPVETDAEAIKKTVRGLSGLDKFLETEGGLVRWHAQF